MFGNYKRSYISGDDQKGEKITVIIEFRNNWPIVEYSFIHAI